MLSLIEFSPLFVVIGAGNNVNPKNYKEVCRIACSLAIKALSDGQSVLDVCEIAVKCLEDCGHTNAGYGSNLTLTGDVECEASIMDGKTLQYGACTNVKDVGNPISLAKALCTRQGKFMVCNLIPPMVLSGEGASKYAKDIGLEIVAPDSLISAKALHRHETTTAKIAKYKAELANDIEISRLDTVGAVVVDNEGNCAAACSSGGIILKFPGRIGQAATYGAGCWAITTDERATACCTTGNGEFLMKTLLAKEICDDLQRSDSSIISIHNTFKTKFLKSPFLRGLNELYGGALSIDYDRDSGTGELNWAHTTKYLCLGYQSTKNKSAKVRDCSNHLMHFCNLNKILL